MNPERWRQVEELYEAALGRTSAQREALLAKVDPDLRREVVALLAGENAIRDSTLTLVGVGAQLGPYKIEVSIGKGGMGEVFRAIDTRLGRKVAIKISTKQFDARFEREAQAIAALNHPHICTLYDVGPNYLVMELLEGETLAARLKNGKLSIDQTIRYGSQIADALSQAHAEGITHRDLKPGNVMVTKAGVKILDFGLAKMKASPGEALTASHVILGTPAYMAPEQLEGKDADARTDIYALGLVLYEMATGKRVVQSQLPTTETFPLPFAHVIERCLANAPDQRWHSATDLKLELEWAGKNPQPAVATATVRSGARRAWPLLIIVGLAAALVIFVFWSRYVDPRADTYSFSPFATEVAEENYPAWSPDGKTIAYFAEVEGVQQIFTKSLGSPAPAQITRSSADCLSPFWSPDGARIYYRSGGLWSVGAAGGEPKLIIPNVQMAAVSSGNSFALIRGAGGNMSLWTASTVTTEPVKYRQAPFPEEFARSWTIDFSRDGSKLAVLMERAGEAGFTTELWIVPLPSGAPQRVLASLPFAAGSPQRPRRISWLPDNRQLVWDSAVPGVPGNHLYLIDTEHPTIIPITHGTGNEWAPSVSPDGEKIAFSTGRNDSDVVQVSIDGRDIHTLLGTSSQEDGPAWSPSGRQFAYVSDSGGKPELWVRSLQDRWATPVLTQGTEGLPLWYGLERPTFSPDGDRIAYGADGSKHAIWISPARGGRPVPIDGESYDQHGAAWSPDGNWIAYQRLRQGKWELVKVPVGGGTPIRLADSGAGGGDTAWSPTGEWLSFIRNGALQLVSSDSKVQKSLSGPPPAAFGFSKDGSLVYLIRRGPNRTWELAASNMGSQEDRTIADLHLPLSATISGFSLNHDGKSFITSVGTPKFDIWLLSGLKRKP